MSPVDTHQNLIRLPAHLVLVGMTGSGKSSVGRYLASALKRDFIDTDKRVESTAGKSVREIFETDGEETFRQFEAQVLREVLASDGQTVVAAAGGVVTRSENRQELRERCNTGEAIVVWLRANTAELLQRVQKGTHRPLLDKDPQGTLASMERARTPLYEEVASVVVDTDELSIDQVGQLVLTLLENRS